jgi:hypothetical protein
MFTPRWGGLCLATVGALGTVGVLLTPTTYSSQFYLGLGPIMFLIAIADGVVLYRSRERRMSPGHDSRLA